MVAWLITLTVVLVTLVFCAILILLARLIVGKSTGSIGSGCEEESEWTNIDKCIQVHESKTRLKPTTIVRSVNLSTQEESDFRKNRDVTSECHYSLHTPLSKSQLDQLPWWSYMFVVVGGFMVCMFLNYVVNRVNAARFDRYEQLQHANDPDKLNELDSPSQQKLKMPTECPKKSKTYGEVKEITLVFTQDENQRLSKQAKCLENVLKKPATSGYSLLSIGNAQAFNQMTRKPIQIKDSVILGSKSAKMLETESINHGAETESVDLDLERQPVHQTIGREPVHQTMESEPVHLTIERQPVHQTIERQPVHQTIERQPAHQTIERQPVHQTVESEPVHPTIGREPIHQTVESEPLHLPIDEEPVHLPIEKEPVQLPNEKEPVQLPNEKEPVPLPNAKEPVQLPNETESQCLSVESVPVHVPIGREPVNVPIHRVEIKNITISASMPSLSHFEITNEVTDTRHYASDVTLSPCNEEKAENKHG